MQHCDLVKFAEHSPTNEDIQKTFDACKEFILETEVGDENETINHSTIKGKIQNAV